MHEVLAIKKVGGLQLASGLRVPERVFSFIFVSLCLSLSLCLQHPNHRNIPEQSSLSEEIDFYLRHLLEVTWIRLIWMSAALWKTQDLGWCDVTLPFSCISCSFQSAWTAGFSLFLWHSASLAFYLSFPKATIRKIPKWKLKLALEYAIEQLLWKKKSILVIVKLKLLENSNAWVLCRVKEEVIHKQHDVNPYGCP